MKQKKLIVLSGVSRGLGNSLVHEFAELGHTVIGCARASSALQELAERYPAPHQFRSVDLAVDDQVAAFAQHLIAEIGAPDLLINNAGVINTNAPLWEVPMAEFNQVLEVNVKGVYSMIRHFVPSMVEQGSGVIVNLSSGWGRSASADVAPYCASKWAIEGLTKALAQELPGGMAAVPLNPGVINTDMLQSCFGESAGNHEKPTQWAKKAAPFILALSAKDNGESLTAQ